MSEGRRKYAIEALLRCDLPVADAVRELNRISGESDTDLVALTLGHIQSVLHRFLGGELSARDVENWADAIEVRDGISTAPGPIDLRQVIFELANPQINQPITHALAEQLMAYLATYPISD